MLLKLIISNVNLLNVKSIARLITVSDYLFMHYQELKNMRIFFKLTRISRITRMRYHKENYCD